MLWGLMVMEGLVILALAREMEALHARLAQITCRARQLEDEPEGPSLSAPTQASPAGKDPIQQVGSLVRGQ